MIARMKCLLGGNARLDKMLAWINGLLGWNACLGEMLAWIKWSLGWSACLEELHAWMVCLDAWNKLRRPVVKGTSLFDVFFTPSPPRFNFGCDEDATLCPPRHPVKLKQLTSLFLRLIRMLSNAGLYTAIMFIRRHRHPDHLAWAYLLPLFCLANKITLFIPDSSKGSGRR